MSEAEFALKRLLRVKPTLDTPFRINYGWWKREGRNLRLELWHHLCPEHQKLYADRLDAGAIDWVDPQTGEVTRIDGLEHLIREHCSRQPNYFHSELPLVDAVFRVFLANGNQPMTPQQLAVLLRRPAEVILRTLGGREVYKGLQPVGE
ncbi:MAG: hypothetical protein D6793_08605 [Thermoflexia bacterium]|nr:MAG: hypothetical protein D6793_08605 [Thermoflexia bacterium]